MPQRTAVFTFVRKSGQNIHIAVDPLRDWLKRRNHPTGFFEVRRDVVETYHRDNIVSPKRVLDLQGRPGILDDPLIVSNFPVDGETMHIDGHHRYIIHHARGHSLAPAYIVHWSQLQPFIIHGFRNFTMQELKDLPITPRRY